MRNKSLILAAILVIIAASTNISFADIFDYGASQPTTTYTSIPIRNQWRNYVPYGYQRPYCPYNYGQQQLPILNNTTTTDTVTSDNGTKKIITTTPIMGNPYYGYNPYYGNYGRRIYNPYNPYNTTSNLGGSILRSLIGLN